MIKNRSKNTNSKHNRMPCDRRHCWMDRRRAQVNRMESQFKLNWLRLLCLRCAVLFSFFLFFIRLLSRWLYECIFSSTSHLIVFTHLSFFLCGASSGLSFFVAHTAFRSRFISFAIQNTSGNPSPKFASTSHKSLASDMNQNFLLLSQRLVCGYTHWGSCFICQMCLNNVCSNNCPTSLLNASPIIAIIFHFMWFPKTI